MYSAYVEIRRAIRILAHNELSFNFAEQVRFRLIEIILGKKEKSKYKNWLLKNKRWTLWGYLGILYGLIAISGGVLLIFIGITSEGLYWVLPPLPQR
jgi:hypothetical protein